MKRPVSRKRPATVLVLIGTRPEAIKLAPILVEIQKHPARLEAIVGLTGQHRSMLDQALEMFSLREQVSFDFKLMRRKQSPTAVLARSLRALEAVLSDRHPDLIIVQGDTTSCLAGALAGFYAGVPVAHVEAGLRTSRRDLPFPEEINRRLTTALATYHFAATRLARDALLAEGVPAGRIAITGNPVIDALKFILARPMPKEAERVLTRAAEAGTETLLLVTAHRRENFGEPMERICGAIAELAARHPALSVVFPVHPNPRVKETVHRVLGGHDRIHLTRPLGYAAFAHVLKAASIVLTDSGGVQEEAPMLGKPVVVLRVETERPEAVALGTARLVGTSISAIVTATEALLAANRRRARSRAVSPYGDGRAAQRIVRFLLRAQPYSTEPALRKRGGR